MRCAKRAPQAGFGEQRVWRTPHPSRLVSCRRLGPSSGPRPPSAASGSPHSPAPSSPAAPIPASWVRDECACHAAAGKARSLPAGVLSKSRPSIGPKFDRTRPRLLPPPKGQCKGAGQREPRPPIRALAARGACSRERCRRWPARRPAHGCGRGWSSLVDTDGCTTGARRVCARCNSRRRGRLQWS